MVLFSVQIRNSAVKNIQAGRIMVLLLLRTKYEIANDFVEIKQEINVRNHRICY